MSRCTAAVVAELVLELEPELEPELALELVQVAVVALELAAAVASAFEPAEAVAAAAVELAVDSAAAVDKSAVVAADPSVELELELVSFSVSDIVVEHTSAAAECTTVVVAYNLDCRRLSEADEQPRSL